MGDCGDQNRQKSSQKVKKVAKSATFSNKDRLYKPLLRMFRSFLRSLIDSVNLSDGCYSWTVEQMQCQVWQFMHLLELPSCFKDIKSLCSMMMLLFPTILKHKKNSNLGFEGMEDLVQALKFHCLEVFQENTIQKRRAFFSDPLIGYLWSIFIDFMPLSVNDYFEDVRNHPVDGEARYHALLTDLKANEQLIGIKILPTGDEVSFEGAIPFPARGNAAREDLLERSSSPMLVAPLPTIAEL